MLASHGKWLTRRTARNKTNSAGVLAERIFPNVALDNFPVASVPVTGRTIQP
jgi:hypothetical protein